MSLTNLRNIAIICAIAAVVTIVPGGGTAASVVIQAVWLIFLAALVWAASVMYRQHRNALFALGDLRRAALYAAIAALAVVLTATHRMWQTPAGSVAWLVVVGVSVYIGGVVLWSARRY